MARIEKEAKTNKDDGNMIFIRFAVLVSPPPKIDSDYIRSTRVYEKTFISPQVANNKRQFGC